MRKTASSKRASWPCCEPQAASALTSFGRQLPPNPQPGNKNELIPAGTRAPSAPRGCNSRIRCTPRITSVASTPGTLAHRLAISFENEISVASRELDVYLMNSAVALLVRTTGVPAKSRYSSCLDILGHARRCRRARSDRAAMKSSMAEPSDRNSGFMPTPRSDPGRRCPEASSRIGRTTPNRWCRGPPCSSRRRRGSPACRAGPRRSAGSPRLT